jgi:hypothetical protein
MKTPTLIVRLVGFYLLLNNGISLFQLNKFRSSTKGFEQMAVNEVSSGMITSLWIGLIAGLVFATMAGRLARLLTFDSEPKSNFDDIVLKK